MAKYHVNSKGKVSVCRANKRPCPLGQSFSSVDSAREFANQNQKSKVEENKEHLLKEKERLTEELKNLKGIKKIKKKKELERVNYALEGRDYDKEKAAERKKREEAVKAAEKRMMESEENSKILANKESIEIPKSIENYINNKPWSRAKVKAYRGEQVAGAQTNTGLALYGQGRYTTTDRSYASKYGTVRDADIEELPAKPLRLKNVDSFQLLEQSVAKENNVDYRDLYKNMDVSDMINKMGYDGLTLGSGKDMIIVKY